MSKLLLVAFALIALAVGRAEPSADPLAHLRPGHPRLLLTDEGLAAGIAAAKTDAVRAALHARIIATAESLLHAPYPRHIPASNLSLDQERFTVNATLHCALAYRLTGDRRFLARAKSEMLHVAAYPDWNPDHFLDVGELSFAVAIGYDWLFAQLTPEERTTLRQALVDKGLKLAATAYDWKGPANRRVEWASSMNNWNQVCNAGVLCAALALADEEPALARRIVAGARASLPIGMAAYAPDGEYPEGPGYWTFGTTYNVIALAALESALGRDLGLGGATGFDRTIDYVEEVHGPTGRPFNYADSTDDIQNSPARAWLAQRFARPLALRHTRALLIAELAERRLTPFDPTIQGQVVNRFFPLHAVWYPAETTAAGAALPLVRHFQGVADLAIMRTAWEDPRALWVGLKAGENTYHHNHLDLGSFVLEADGVRWAVDLGPDVYELPGYPHYRTPERWRYYRTNNFGHNTVTPGTVLQRRQITAPIGAFGDAAGRSFAVVDLTAAYPDEAASLHRGLALLDNARVLVQDEYTPKATALPLYWQMVTRARIEIAADGRSALLLQDGRRLRVEVLAPATARLGIGSTKPPLAAENQNVGTSALVIEVKPSAAPETTTLAVLLTPVGDRWPEKPVPHLQRLANWR